MESFVSSKLEQEDLGWIPVRTTPRPPPPAPTTTLSLFVTTTGDVMPLFGSKSKPKEPRQSATVVQLDDYVDPAVHARMMDQSGAAASQSAGGNKVPVARSPPAPLLTPPRFTP